MIEGITRRTLLGSALLVGGIAASATWLWSRVEEDESGAATDEQRRLLAIVSDHVIPRTDTPGAVDVGVPAYVMLALNHGLDGTAEGGASGSVTSAAAQPRQRGGMAWLERLVAELNLQAGEPFVTATSAKQQQVLDALDRTAFAPGGEGSPWRRIKRLILIGYYTSEPGASQELRYSLVPARWDADIPLTPGMRAFSSDWTAVDFG